VVDQRRSLHIGDAALPQALNAAPVHDLSEGVTSGVDSGRFAHQPPPALHLDLHLDQVGGRGQPLGNGSGGDAAQRRLPNRQRLTAVLGELLPHQVVAADPHTAADGHGQGELGLELAE